MADRELLGLNETTPQIVAPTASDRGVLVGSLLVGGVTTYQYLTGASASLAANPPSSIAVGDLFSVSAYSSSSAKYPATWRCSSISASLPSGATAGIVTGNAAGALYLLKTGTTYYKFEVVGVASILAFGAASDGATDDIAAIDAMLANKGVVIIPEGTTYIASAIDVDSSSAVISGSSQKTSILLVADGVTGIRSLSDITIKDLTIRCNRNETGTWSSTAAKGIYIKDGPDSVASDPTAYIAKVRIKNVAVQRFYESIEIDGAYNIELSDVETIHDFRGLIFNRNDTSGFTGTTLSMVKVWCRGTGGTYATPASSRGVLIYDFTNLNFSSFSVERYVSVGELRTLQSGFISDCYFENCTNGPEFHTLTGKVWLVSVYYNNIGNTFVSGGFTIKVSYGQLNYSPSRFVGTANSATIDTDGELFVVGNTVSTRTGASSANYRHVDYDGISNALLDYAEGTWTPTYSPASAFSSISYNVADTVGSYVKTGALVVCTGRIGTNSISGGSGAVSIGGLPYTARNTTGASVGNAFLATAVDFTGDYPSSGIVVANTKTAALRYRTAANGATATLDVSDLNTGAGNAMSFTITYMTDE